MSVRKHIPNAITSCNLFCGAAGLVFAFSGRFDIAFFLMIAGAVFDFCDGLAARLLNYSSPVGKELDSLADIISFGVLPASLLHCLMKAADAPFWLSLSPLLLAVFSGLRLARFNIDERQHSSFIGLPTPSAAMICSSLAAYCYYQPASWLAGLCSSRWFIPALALLLCWLLVSEVPMFSFKLGSHKSEEDGAESLLRTKTDMKRTAFLSIAVIILAIVLVLGGHWTLIPLGIFSSYVLENLLFALFRI